MENQTYISPYQKHPLRIVSIMENKFSPIHLMASNGIKICAFPDRWGIVTSLNFRWTEILYQDMLSETLSDETKSVKWGIPILFPNAGPLIEDQKEKSWYTLPQHGFARVNPWKKEDPVLEDQLVQSLSSEDIRDTFGYDFEWRIINSVSVIDKNTVLFEYYIQNKSKDTLPISFWLHPYFDVPLWNKSEIQWNFEGWDIIKDDIQNWSTGGTTKIDIPKDNKLNISIPWIGSIYIEVSPDLRRLWIWSLPWKNFVCIEPVMSDEWGIIDNPVLIKPNSEHLSSMKISLIKKTN